MVGIGEAAVAVALQKAVDAVGNLAPLCIALVGSAQGLPGSKAHGGGFDGCTLGPAGDAIGGGQLASQRQHRKTSGCTCGLTAITLQCRHGLDAVQRGAEAGAVVSAQLFQKGPARMAVVRCRLTFQRIRELGTGGELVQAVPCAKGALCWHVQQAHGLARLDASATLGHGGGDAALAGR